MTKNVLFGVLLIVMVACGAPQSDRPDSSGTNVPTADKAGFEEIDIDDEDFDVPPENALLLSEILASIEVAGHNAITGVEFKDGVWEVEFVVGDEKFEIEIDPMTGEALSDEPERADDD